MDVKVARERAQSLSISLPFRVAMQVDNTCAKYHVSRSELFLHLFLQFGALSPEQQKEIVTAIRLQKEVVP